MSLGEKNSESVGEIAKKAKQRDESKKTRETVCGREKPT